MIKKKATRYFVGLVLLLLQVSLGQARHEKEWVTPDKGSENNKVVITQITDSEGANNFQASISADGSRIAFASNYDFTGENPDGNTEIFLWREQTGDFIQITDSIGGDVGEYLFSVGQEFVAELNRSEVSEALREQFRSRGRALIPPIRVPVEQAGRRWRIFDANANRSFYLQREAQRLNVYDGKNPANFEPRISADGRSIAFSSNRDLLNGGDMDLDNREIFLWREDVGIIQITDTTGGDDNANRLPSVPSLSQTITRIAFVSNRYQAGPPPPDNTHQIVLAILPPPLRPIQIVPITNTRGGVEELPNLFANSEPSININGSRIAFSSNRNHTGANPRQNREIFLWDGAFRQITPAPPTDTNGNRDNIQPSLNGDGRRIAFSSNRNNLMGMPHNNHEIFLWMEPNTFRRITTSQGGDIAPNFAANANPSINPLGDSIAFTSNRNLMGGGDGHREIFLWRENGAGRIIQITMSDCMPTIPMTPETCPGEDDNRSPSISGNGRRVAFDSNRDLLGIYSNRGKGRSGPVVIFHHDASHDIFIGDLSSPD